MSTAAHHSPAPHSPRGLGTGPRANHHPAPGHHNKLHHNSHAGHHGNGHHGNGHHGAHGHHGHHGAHHGSHHGHHGHGHHGHGHHGHGHHHEPTSIHFQLTELGAPYPRGSPHTQIGNHTSKIGESYVSDFASYNMQMHEHDRSPRLVATTVTTTAMDEKTGEYSKVISRYTVQHPGLALWPVPRLPKVIDSETLRESLVENEDYKQGPAGFLHDGATMEGVYGAIERDNVNDVDNEIGMKGGGVKTFYVGKGQGKGQSGKGQQGNKGHGKGNNDPKQSIRTATPLNKVARSFSATPGLNPRGVVEGMEMLHNLQIVSPVRNHRSMGGMVTFGASGPGRTTLLERDFMKSGWVVGEKGVLAEELEKAPEERLRLLREKVNPDMTSRMMKEFKLKQMMQFGGHTLPKLRVPKTQRSVLGTVSFTGTKSLALMLPGPNLAANYDENYFRRYDVSKMMFSNVSPYRYHLPAAEDVLPDVFSTKYVNDNFEGGVPTEVILVTNEKAGIVLLPAEGTAEAGNNANGEGSGHVSGSVDASRSQSGAGEKNESATSSAPENSIPIESGSAASASGADAVPATPKPLDHRFKRIHILSPEDAEALASRPENKRKRFVLLNIQGKPALVAAVSKIPDAISKGADGERVAEGLKTEREVQEEAEKAEKAARGEDVEEEVDENDEKIPESRMTTKEGIYEKWMSYSQYEYRQDDPDTLTPRPLPEQSFTDKQGGPAPPKLGGFSLRPKFNSASRLRRSKGEDVNIEGSAEHHGHGHHSHLVHMHAGPETNAAVHSEEINTAVHSGEINLAVSSGEDHGVPHGFHPHPHHGHPGTHPDHAVHDHSHHPDHSIVHPHDSHPHPKHPAPLTAPQSAAASSRWGMLKQGVKANAGMKRLALAAAKMKTEAESAAIRLKAQTEGLGMGSRQAEQQRALEEQQRILEEKQRALEAAEAALALETQRVELIEMAERRRLEELEKKSSGGKSSGGRNGRGSEKGDGKKGVAKVGVVKKAARGSSPKGVAAGKKSASSGGVVKKIKKETNEDDMLEKPAKKAAVKKSVKSGIKKSSATAGSMSVRPGKKSSEATVVGNSVKAKAAAAAADSVKINMQTIHEQRDSQEGGKMKKSPRSPRSSPRSASPKASSVTTSGTKKVPAKASVKKTSVTTRKSSKGSDGKSVGVAKKSSSKGSDGKGGKTVIKKSSKGTKKPMDGKASSKRAVAKKVSGKKKSK